MPVMFLSGSFAVTLQCSHQCDHCQDSQILKPETPYFPKPPRPYLSLFFAILRELSRFFAILRELSRFFAILRELSRFFAIPRYEDHEPHEPSRPTLFIHFVL